jgi:phage terminase Nu1 subunit (DNA packaging protein)
MDARDICRKLNCSPVLLSEWVERGCPIDRYPPYAGFETDKVKQWLAENGITDLPKENDQDLDVPIRVILKALQRKEITPWQAEKVIMNLGSGNWG